MNTKPAYITDNDMKKLRELLTKAQNWPQREAQYLEKLAERLEKATVIDHKETPANLVTMNCHVRVTELNEKRDTQFWLAYPLDAMHGSDKKSIVSDLGVAILGRYIGEKVRCEMGERQGLYRISQILYQPEQNKHFQL